MTAIGNLVDGLFDYAGLYPPASLDLATAVESYTTHRQSENAHALGHFVIGIERLDAMRHLACQRFRHMRLSIIISADRDWDLLARWLDDGALIEAVEVKATAPSSVEKLARHLSAGLAAYIEVPASNGNAELLDAICAVGARVKLRMGGVVAEAIPSSQSVVESLLAIADRHLQFKATGGLHHPLRSRHPLTYLPDSVEGTMHGFVNLCCAAAVIHAGGDAADATRILEEADPKQWRVSADAIACLTFAWSAEQIRALRQEFFVSIGSCSFTEPMADLEALGWR